MIAYENNIPEYPTHAVASTPGLPVIQNPIYSNSMYIMPENKIAHDDIIKNWSKSKHI